MWHLLWTLALSVISAFCMIIGAVFRWNWIKLYEQVQHKADRTDVSAKHADNVIRLEEIKKMLLHSEKVSSSERDAVRGELNALNMKVAVLADRAGLSER